MSTSFENWVKGKYNKAMTLENIHIIVCESTRTVILINLKTGHSAMAKCSKNDTFNDKVGIAVACAKFYNEKIPDYI